MNINEYLQGKTIIKAEVSGFDIILTLSDGNVFNYDSTDGGYSSWQLTDKDGNDVDWGD